MLLDAVLVRPAETCCFTLVLHLALVAVRCCLVHKVVALVAMYLFVLAAAPHLRAVLWMYLVVLPRLQACLVTYSC